MREEKLARSISGALVALPIVFLPLYLIWGFAFARSVLFFGFGCTAVGIAAGWLLGRRHVLLQIAASALPAALLALAVPVTAPGADIIRWCLMGLGALHAVWSERRSVVSGDMALKPGLLLAPLLALLFVSVILWFTGKSNGTTAADVWALLLPLGALWFAVAMFLLNRLALRQAAHAGSHSDVPEGTRRSGTAGVVIFVAISFVLAGISGIVQTLSTAFRAAATWLIQAIVYLMLLISNLFSSKTEQPQASGGQQEMLPIDKGEASPLAELISKIVIVIILLAVVVAIIYGLKKLFPKLWAKLRERLSSLFASWKEEDAGYQDRSESLLSFRQALTDAGAQLKKLARRFRRKPRIGDFPTNAGRVRFLFREYLGGLIAARREPPAGATATEIAKAVPALASAYNRARYAEEEPSDTELEQAMEQMQK